jgi:hypothetical protein
LELLPPDGPVDHAADLLADMKTMILGEGEVLTHPAQQALAQQSGQGAHPIRGPPEGLKSLRPQDARWSVKSAIIPADQPLAADVARLEAKLRETTRGLLDKKRAVVRQEAAKTLEAVDKLRTEVQSERDQKEKLFKELELKDLSPAERVFALEMSKEKKPPDIKESLEQHRLEEWDRQRGLRPIIPPDGEPQLSREERKDLDF